MNLNLWVLTNEFKPYIIGGLGVVATHLAYALGKYRSNIIVVAAGTDSGVKIEHSRGIKIIRLPKNLTYYSNKKQFFLFLPVVRWLRNTGESIPDVIHIHSVQFADVAFYYREKYGVPLIYTCHSLVMLEKKSRLRELVQKRQEKLLRISDKIVVPSVWQQKKLEEFYPYCIGKVEIIENGVKVKEPGNTASRRRLLFIGRLVRHKGIEELLKATAILARKVPSVKVSIVGTGSKKYVAHLKILAQHLGIDSNVCWLGFQPMERIESFYVSHGAVIVPSHRESFGMVAMEALANGTPLVSTRFGGLSQFVSGRVAEIIPRVKSTDIAKAVRNMWTKKKITQKRIEEGRRVAIRYDWANIAARYHDLFLSVRLNTGDGGKGDTK
ncbi:glycosyltransferase family 4 protein [Aneurinibacillus terranovensis]|uniref:glycosyltransferase family 4 protein n=1 Tax=Aneurinibacillus terranovensis TaxID=278991 RepID=UPI00041009FA|nr:glycosyltransferase family 4 protein [Aneurinibacillus terranovensis]